MAISSNRLLLNRYLHFWLFYVYSFATGGMYNFLFITVEKRLLQLRQLELDKMNKLRKYLRLIEILVPVLDMNFSTNSVTKQNAFQTKCLLIKHNELEQNLFNPHWKNKWSSNKSCFSFLNNKTMLLPSQNQHYWTCYQNLATY